MHIPGIQDIQEGKLIKEIDFQILMCREKIRSHERSIEKIKRMADIKGPSGIKAVDLSGMPKTRFSRMEFPDAVALIVKDEGYIAQERMTIKSLRRRRRNLIRAAEMLEGIEQGIFVCRVLYGMTQEVAAETIGVSSRQLQRIERQMRQDTKVFEL